MRSIQALVLLSVLVSASPALGAAFVPLGDLPGGGFASYAHAVSADGSVVVGTSDSSSGLREAFVWTEASGIVGIGDLPGGAFESEARGVSDDGTIVVGVSETGTSLSGLPTFEAFRWTESSGLIGLGVLGIGSNGEDFFSTSWGAAISGDGEVIGGGTTTGQSAAGVAYSWRQGAGMVALPGFSPSLGSDVLALSADGTTAVGSAGGQGPQNAGGFVWEAGVPTFFGAFPDAIVPTSHASDVSADGQVVVGHAASGEAAPGHSQAFRWTEATGLAGLGFLDPDDPDPFAPFSNARGVSGDGAIVVGMSSVAGPELFEGFVWDEPHGMRKLRDVLTDDYGLDLTDWGPLMVEAISTDGRAIVGFARNPSGDDEAFLVLLPEPGPVWLLATGTLVMSGARRRSRACGSCGRS